VIERFRRLPVPVRMGLVAAVMCVATILDIVYIVKTSPWRIDVVIAGVLGAIAAWPFSWRADTRAKRAALMVGIAAFGAVMVWARVTGRIQSSFAFVFSVLLLSIPVQRARGPREAPPSATS
jgi:hypothetical protein